MRNVRRNNNLVRVAHAYVIPASFVLSIDTIVWRLYEAATATKWRFRVRLAKWRIGIICYSRYQYFCHFSANSCFVRVQSTIVTYHAIVEITKTQRGCLWHVLLITSRRIFGFRAKFLRFGFHQRVNECNPRICFDPELQSGYDWR